jgi:hypothetical protein
LNLIDGRDHRELHLYPRWVRGKEIQVETPTQHALVLYTASSANGSCVYWGVEGDKIVFIDSKSPETGRLVMSRSRYTALRAITLGIGGVSHRAWRAMSLLWFGRFGLRFDKAEMFAFIEYELGHRECRRVTEVTAIA